MWESIALAGVDQCRKLHYMSCTQQLTWEISMLHSLPGELVIVNNYMGYCI